MHSSIEVELNALATARSLKEHQELDESKTL